MTNYHHLCFGCMENKGDAHVCPSCGWAEGTEKEAPQHLSPGTVLQDKYLLGKVLGHGGFGITYLAWDLNLEMKLAVKEYMPRDFATRSPEHTIVSVFTGQLQSHFEHGLKKFLDEAKTLAQFSNHPGIVGVRDFFRDNGTAYLVMYYVEGIDFKKYLEMQGGKIPYQTALAIMMPVLDALREVHRTGTLHRDISPDNIFITTEGQVKILDFGAARHAMNEFNKSISVILKPGYAPEEQYRSKGKQGPWTDVYAAAATLYRAIVGFVPPESLDRLEEDTIQLPSQLGCEIPQDAESALMKALAVRQTERYQSIEEFQQQLLQQGEVISNIVEKIEPKEPIKGEVQSSPKMENEVKPQKTEPPKKKISKGLWIAGGAALFGLVSMGIVLMLILNSFFDKDPVDPVDPVTPTILKEVTVPNVLDLTEEEAKSALTKESLQVGNVVYVESTIVKKGHVIKQSIESNKKVKENDVINLEISKGVELPVDVAKIQSQQLELVNEYWNNGYELDKQNDLNGALKLYIQARDIAAEIVKYNGDLDAQFAQGALSRDIASVKTDLGHYYYALQDANESVRILEDLYAKDTVFQNNPVELAYAYGVLSDIQIINKVPKEAIASAEKGLQIDPSQKWINVNLAHGYLFSGEFERAEGLYMKYKDEEVNGQPLKEYILEDFKYYREINVTHPDMNKIEDALKDKINDKEEIELTIYANAISMEEEDVDGYMGTIDPDSPVNAETEELLHELFNGYDDFVVDIKSIKVLDINGNTARVRVEQYLSYSDGQQKYESSSTFIHTLVRSDGVFKWLIKQTETEGEGKNNETL